MEYKSAPCKVIAEFETYEEVVEYMMKNKDEMNSNKRKQRYPFEQYFARVLREHPILYDEKHRGFGSEFPTKHAWSVVGGYMMMETKEVQNVWATFQKYAKSGVQLYVDLVNYVKLGDGNGWIDVDQDSDNESHSENEGESVEDNCCVKEEEVFNVKEEEVAPSIKMEIE